MSDGPYYNCCHMSVHAGHAADCNWHDARPVGKSPVLAMPYVSRPKDWIQTYTGRQFWPTEPRAVDVNIVDIAHSLGMKCRYSGHCKFFYSVAEHSVHVSHFLPPELQLWGLLHDAAEAYLVDVPRPIKPFLPGFKELEAAVMAVICQRYDLPVEEPAEVKRIDTAILADEMRQVMGPPPANWHLPENPLGVTIEGWSPERAKSEFLRRFYDLTEVTPALVGEMGRPGL